MDNIKFTVERIEILYNYGVETSRQYLLTAEDGIKVAIIVPNKENRTKEELVNSLRTGALFRYKETLEEKRKEKIADANRLHVGDVI